MSAGDWGLLAVAVWLSTGVATLAWLLTRRPVPDGSHDVLPEVDDWWREVAYDHLEQMWALPARERAS